jgi:hypothetical protein
MITASEILNILNEGVSPIVYHGTSSGNTVDMLRDNRFRLSPGIGRASDQAINRGKFYFLAVSRVKKSGYEQTIGTGRTMLVLDGRKLNQRYKGVSVDYWGRDPEMMRKKNQVQYWLRSDENEDRILSDKPYIPNARNYIKEIHIWLGDDPINDYYSEVYTTLNKIKGKIPVYYYWNKQDYYNQNKRKALSFEALGISGVSPREGKFSYERQLSPYISGDAEAILAVYEKDLKDFSDKDNKFWSRASYSYKAESIVNALNKVLGEKEPSPEFIELKSRIIKQMKKVKKMNINSFAEHTQKLYNKKWKAKEQQEQMNAEAQMLKNRERADQVELERYIKEDLPEHLTGWGIAVKNEEDVKIWIQLLADIEYLAGRFNEFEYYHDSENLKELKRKYPNIAGSFRVPLINAGLLIEKEKGYIYSVSPRGEQVINHFRLDTTF